jgi:hypothetical protein
LGSLISETGTPLNDAFWKAEYRRMPGSVAKIWSEKYDE